MSATGNDEYQTLHDALVDRLQARLMEAFHALHNGQGSARGWAHDLADHALDVVGITPSSKFEQPRAATADVDPQDAAASLGELSLPAKDGAGLPVSPPRFGASSNASREAET